MKQHSSYCAACFASWARLKRNATAKCLLVSRSLSHSLSCERFVYKHEHSGLSHSLRVIRIASCAFTFLDAALPVGRTPSQRLCVLLRICSDCTTPQLCATGSRVGGSGCFNLALEPSHLRHSARVLTTSRVPTHNTCATLQTIVICSYVFIFAEIILDA